MTVSFDDIAEELDRRIRRVVWCSASTVDPLNRTRVRIVHPVWDSTTAWITTNRHSPKERHLAHNPHVSLCYLEVLDPWGTEQVYADCTAAWADDGGTRHRVWELIKSIPAPMGFDPAVMWKGPDDPEFGLLALTPWRIELQSLKPNEEGWRSLVWRP